MRTARTLRTARYRDVAELLQSNHESGGTFRLACATWFAIQRRQSHHDWSGGGNYLMLSESSKPSSAVYATTQAILLRDQSESLKKPFIVVRSTGMDCGSFLPLRR